MRVPHCALMSAALLPRAAAASSAASACDAETSLSVRVPMLVDGVQFTADLTFDSDFVAAATADATGAAWAEERPELLRALADKCVSFGTNIELPTPPGGYPDGAKRHPEYAKRRLPSRSRMTTVAGWRQRHVHGVVLVGAPAHTDAARRHLSLFL